MPAGYSGRPLVQKLGLKPHAKAWFHHAPDDYLLELGEIPAGVTFPAKRLQNLDFVHAFFKQRSRLLKEFPKLKAALTDTGCLWISWPKKASGVETDVTEDLVRQTGLTHGLVDIKICAVTEVWSGLKFVYRVKDRKPRN